MQLFSLPPSPEDHMPFPSSIPRAHTPVADAVDALENDLQVCKERSEVWSYDRVPACLQGFIEEFWKSRWTKAPEGQPAVADAAEAFCGYVIDLAMRLPAKEELQAAPIIDHWCALRSNLAVGIHPCLIGYVTGHPRLRNGARTITSTLIRVEPADGWARTWNRLYRLGAGNDAIFHDLVRGRKLPPAAEIDRDIAHPMIH